MGSAQHTSLKRRCDPLFGQTEYCSLPTVVLRKTQRRLEGAAAGLFNFFFKFWDLEYTKRLLPHG